MDRVNTMVGSMDIPIKTFVGAKTITKENASGVVLFEAKLTKFVSETKAKVKTMRVQLDEQKKAGVSRGKGDVYYNQYFKPVYEEAEKAVKAAEDRVKKFIDVDVAGYNTVLSKAKAVK